MAHGGNTIGSLPTERTSRAAASARVLAAINRKRGGEAFAGDEIEAIIADFVAGRVPDYQMSAWLATVACRGLSVDENRALTRSYTTGGSRIDLSMLDGPVVDKHSTGGVGDTTTLIVVPVVAACGVHVVKMTGRALGYAGGTLDKLESIPGLRVELPVDEVVPILRDVGMVITGQSAGLAPGDGATYSLRDVTGTVESLPLIAASIISKKVAVHADGLVLDVKTGEGALVPERDEAGALAQRMLDLAISFGLRARAVISDMSQPLGRAVGNSLEIKQALAVLRGHRVPGLYDLCAVISALMLRVAQPELTEEEAAARVERAIDSGAAHEVFLRWACAQGADGAVLADPASLPRARHCVPVAAARAGKLTCVHPRPIAMAALLVGAGRLTQRAQLDHGAGVVVHRRVGEEVAKGDLLAELHHSSGDAESAWSLVRSAFEFGDDPVAEPLIHQIL
ncbi:pyrimidine-nucleoside phosphorylase [Saccharomonospora marina XMU15]|uniref:Pyrimidine-nucleoside phosphorylase n=2 Tax=Saccharomonospora TaxID=1851 RepID=H5X6Z6_9PSEU|nr:pyrimidine-nucleoside phosphorylase [Saccharomonospora marina XMU15]